MCAVLFHCKAREEENCQYNCFLKVIYFLYFAFTGRFKAKRQTGNIEEERHQDTLYNIFLVSGFVCFPCLNMNEKLCSSYQGGQYTCLCNIF